MGTARFYRGGRWAKPVNRGPAPAELRLVPARGSSGYGGRRPCRLVLDPQGLARPPALGPGRAVAWLGTGTGTLGVRAGWAFTWAGPQLPGSQ